MLKNSKWISAGVGEYSPCIVKKFNIESSISSALLSITGLGYFIAKINGREVTRDLFNPTFSNYRERNYSSMLYPLNDTMTNRVYFCEYDVAALLKEGRNTLEIYLGNGWYNQDKRTAEGHLEFGKQLIARFSLCLTDDDGKKKYILSDGSELWRRTEVVENNLFYGEIHDYRLKGQRKIYRNVIVEPEFETELTRQTCPAEAVIRKIKPRLIKQNGNKRVYDAGETVSGWVKVKARGKRGDLIVINHSETLTEDGDINPFSVGGEILNDKGEPQLQLMKYVLDGKIRYLYPKFSKQAFRYFEIEGEFLSLTVELVYNKMDERTTFSSDNEVLNWLYTAYKRTQAINMHDGMPSDCPHRERLGYTGDGQITASSAMTFFDCDLFYQKWIQDILDCQDINNGHIQHTAPFYGGGGGPVGWGGAIVQVPYAHYLHYRNRSVIEKAFPAMLKWVDYICHRTEKGLVCKEEEGGWCLGDWSSIYDCMEIPQEFVNSALFVQNLNRMCYLAREIGANDSIENLKALAEQYKKAITEHFYNDKTCSFCDGIQGADAYALSIGLGNEQTHKNLVKKYTDSCYFDTGFLGTYQLIEYLLGSGEVDLAFKLLSSKEYGSFGYLMSVGENTICEKLYPWGSHAHPMFGGVAEFLMSALLGFPVSCVDENILLKPCFPSSVGGVCGSTVIAGKKITVEWERSGNKILLSATIPDTISAMLDLYDEKIQLKKGKNTLEISLQKSYNSRIAEYSK